MRVAGKIEAVVMNIADDADNRHFGTEHDANALADRIGARPELPGRTLTDDRNRRGLRVVVPGRKRLLRKPADERHRLPCVPVVEQPPAAERDAERCKVMRRRDAKWRVW